MEQMNGNKRTRTLTQEELTKLHKDISNEGINNHSDNSDNSDDEYASSDDELLMKFMPKKAQNIQATFRALRMHLLLTTSCPKCVQKQFALRNVIVTSN